VEEMGKKMSDVYFMCLYVSKMSDFAAVNAVYKTYFGINPPAR
jgi:enamine deaminase RidA (YjgF/YER057c/UK114 family)